MLLAIPLIIIDFGQDLYELLFGVIDRPEQFIVEMQDLSPAVVSRPAVIRLDMLVQLCADFAEPTGHIGIDRLPNSLTLTERFDRLMAAARQDRQTVGDL